MVGGTPVHGSGLAATASGRVRCGRYVGLLNRTFVRLPLGTEEEPLGIGQFLARTYHGKAPVGQVMAGQVL